MANFLFLIISALYATTLSLPAGPKSDVQYTSLVITPFSNVGEVKNKKISQFIKTKAFPVVPQFPDSGRKHAILEKESLVSKADTAYGNLLEFVAGFYHPRPVVDTIQEHEKYGNDGGKIRSASVSFIAGVEGIANLANAAIDVPYDIITQVGRKFFSTASSVGAKIAGL